MESRKKRKRWGNFSFRKKKAERGIDYTKKIRKKRSATGKSPESFWGKK